MYFETKNKKQCCGCKVCSAICPVHAITFTFDKEGFWYPEIDADKCILCDKCKEACPLNTQAAEKIQDKNQTYAGFSLSSAVLDKSTSGGVFTHISDWFLEKKGYVFGHMYSEQIQPICCCADTKEKRDFFCGSKYVQSDMGTVYETVRTKTETGVPVLITGTPCQIDAVKNYFGNMIPDNMFTMDIVCHGVPSPGIFAEYKSLCEKKKRKKISNVVFRSKQQGWTNPVRILEYTDGSSDKKLLNDDSFNYLFLRTDCILRPSCYECRYAGTERISDITIADFWGIQIKHPEMFNNNGVSLIIVNTEKGQKLFDITKTSMHMKQVPLIDAQEKNVPLNHPMYPYIERHTFFKDYEKRGLAFCLRKYTSTDFFHRAYRKLKRLLFSIADGK